MPADPKKLDIEAAFRSVAQPPEAPFLGNEQRLLKPLFQIRGPTKRSFLGDLFLVLFSLSVAVIAFIAVFKLTGRSPRALYYALTAAAAADRPASIPRACSTSPAIFGFA
jgi:hypothetical protein